MITSSEQFIEIQEQELAREQGLTITSAKFLDLDKGAIKDMAMAVVDEYQDGFKSPAEGLLLARKLEELAVQIKDNLKDSAASELKLGKGEKANVHGATVTEQMTGVKYSYKDCSDPVWNELNEKIKNREAFLKTIKGSKQELIEETGEVVEIYEPVKSGSMSLIFKY